MSNYKSWTTYINPRLTYNVMPTTSSWSSLLQENQDKFLLQLNREDGWSIMGVFDGHGNWGGRVATAVRDSILSAMKKVDGRKMNGSDPEAVQLFHSVSNCCQKMILTTCTELLTCCCIVVCI